MIRLAVLIVTLALCACASQPEYASFTALSAGSTIAVEAFGGITESGQPDSRVGELAFEGAVTGTAAGMQVGMETGEGLTGDCGEFIVVCLGLLPAFALAGMASGVIVGSAAGLVEGMPYQNSEAMQEAISAYFEKAPPNQIFSETFIDIASAGLTIDPQAENKVTVAVIGVRPKKARGKTMAFEVTTAMSVDYAGAKTTTKPYQFTTVTAAYGATEWIDGGQALYSSELEKAYTESASVFVALLRRPPRR